MVALGQNAAVDELDRKAAEKKARDEAEEKERIAEEKRLETLGGWAAFDGRLVRALGSGEALRDQLTVSRLYPADNDETEVKLKIFRRITAKGDSAVGAYMDGAKSFKVGNDRIQEEEQTLPRNLSDKKVQDIVALKSEEERTAAWRKILNLMEGDSDTPPHVREFEYQTNLHPQGWFHWRKVTSKKALSKHMRFYTNANSVLSLFKPSEWDYLCFNVKKDRMPKRDDMECATPTFGIFLVNRNDPNCVIKMHSVTSRANLWQW